MKKLPRIGTWLFSTAQCPPNAAAVVMNSDGEVVWFTGEHTDRVCRNDSGGWDYHGRGSVWYHNQHDRIYCDPKDYLNSFILKPKIKNIATEKTIMLLET